MYIGVRQLFQAGLCFAASPTFEPELATSNYQQACRQLAQDMGDASPCVLYQWPHTRSVMPWYANATDCANMPCTSQTPEVDVFTHAGMPR